MSSPPTARWWSPLGFDEATASVKAALERLGMNVSDSAGLVRATARTSLKRNRWRTAVNVTLAESDGGTAITCTVDAAVGQRAATLGRVRAELAGVLYDHEITAAAAHLKRTQRLALGTQLDHLRRALDARERVVALESGLWERKAGVLALTSDRVLFVGVGAISNVLLEYPLDAVSSVRVDVRLLAERVEIRTNSASGVIDGLSRGRADAFATALRAQLGQRSSTAELPTQHAADAIGRLERLAALHQQGSLDDEEFARLKAAILDPP